jgi:hypothetical protein
LLHFSDRRLAAYGRAAQEVAENSEFGAELVDLSLGRRLISTDLAPHAIKWLDDYNSRLATMSDRARARLAVADRLAAIERPTEYVHNLVDKLKRARRTATVAIRLADGKKIYRWDVKTGNSRVDPDDAREESNRFSKRLAPKLLELIAGGHYVTYAVFTTPNVEPGKLKRETRAIYRRFSNLLRRCKRGRVPGCASIVGAACVLEAPLSAHREWNVHLNVLLVHRGTFIDYGELRKAWHWQVHFKRVHGDAAGIAAAMREVIKYAVQTVPEKSGARAADRREAERGEAAPLSSDRADHYDAGVWRDPAASGDQSARLDREARECSPGAPAFVEWRDVEILEWLAAFQRFRRTRTYGELYRLPPAEKLDRSKFLELGLITWQGRAGGYAARFPLLDSIPGDKSASAAERWARLCRALGYHGPPAERIRGAAG